MSEDKQTGIDGLAGGWGALGAGYYVRPTAGGWVFLATVSAEKEDSLRGERSVSTSVSVSISASVVFIPDPTWSWKEYRRVCSRPKEGEE